MFLQQGIFIYNIWTLSDRFPKV